MNGLNMPTGGAGIPDQQQSSIAQFWNTYPNVCTMLQTMGFNPLSKPDGVFPHITPADYANIEGEQYTQIMALVDVWFVYARDAQAWIEAKVIGLNEEVKDLERENKRAMRAQYANVPKKDQPNETTLKEEAQAYPRCREIRQELVCLDGMMGVIKARLDGCERLSSGLSRQITIRGQNIELGGRTGGRPHTPIRG